MLTSSHFPWGPALLLALTALAHPAAAQLNLPAAHAENVAGTGGTVISTPNQDDANSASQAIGFSFPFAGVAGGVSSFILNTNGFLSLAGTAPSAANQFLTYAQSESQMGTGPTNFPGGPLAGPDNFLVLPFATDLTAASSGPAEYRYQTTGTAPNRVCTVQWKNVKEKPRATNSFTPALIGTQYESFSFQAKLYETGQVEFVYGPGAAGAGPDDFRMVLVGLKGTSQTDAVVADKGSQQAWSLAIFRDDAYLTTLDPHNVRSTVRPDVGRTYRFTPLLANDLAVQLVQALTQLPVPQGAPHPVRALVTNVGAATQSNVTVTLTVTGANTYTATQTIATLPGGTTAVTFASYAPTNPGPTTLTVSVPPDGSNANNSASLAQQVNTTTYSYADPGTWQSARGFAPGGAFNVGAMRIRTSTALQVTQVRAMLATSVAAPAPGSSVGKTVYAVLLNAAGAVLARSADYVTGAGDPGNYVTFSLTSPPTLSAGSDAYVGLVQTYQPGQTTQYFPLGGQPDGPGRPNTFYGASTTQVAAPTDLVPSGGIVGLADKLMIEAVTQTVLGTRNAALAAQVGLYPNPAHGAFAVQVPAGPLGAATATLHNALGQVVLTRHLGLPAAGGTAEFDVRGLAAGVYTLQLLAGDALVVKRVVLE